ncbi:MAG: LysM domain-containing protein [Acidobacteria bacterium]|nr:LysM domain-containing protein [Acidobacteriota bacterium]
MATFNSSIDVDNTLASLPGGSGQYIVHPGDTLRIIAERLHIPIGDLLGANPSIYNVNLIFTGQSIKIPNTYRTPR